MIFLNKEYSGNSINICSLFGTNYFIYFIFARLGPITVTRNMKCYIEKYGCL